MDVKVDHIVIKKLLLQTKTLHHNSRNITQLDRFSGNKDISKGFLIVKVQTEHLLARKY